jgi:tellurium resistance protein TerD
MSTTTAPTLNLSKDQKVDLTKTNPGLKKVAMGLGWDLQDGKTFDLDSFAFLCKDGKAIDADPNKCVCYFRNLTLPGCVHSGDNLTGAGDGDDETITVEFAALPADCNEVYIGVNIYNQPNANFGMVKNAFCRAYNAEDAAKASIIRYDLSEDHGSTNAIIFGKLYKHGEEWKFQALGEQKSGDINQLLQNYR